MKILRMLKEVPRWVKYILIFCTGMLILSIFYPYIKDYAMAHRTVAVPGGEMLLWLLPFIVCVAVSTAKLWRKGSKG